MLRSLYTSATGMVQNQRKLDVIGDNFANLNTTGYKTGRMSFEDVFNRNISMATPPGGGKGGINPTQIGNGISIGSIDKNFEQGNFEDTGLKTDLAINGAGFFVMQGLYDDMLYSRAGNFSVDGQGNMVNGQGYHVMGYDLNPFTGELLGDAVIRPINIGGEFLSIPAMATSDISMNGMLDSRATESIVTFDKFMTVVDGDTPIFETYGVNGEPIDLVEGEALKIKANANKNTLVGNLYSSDGINLGFDNNTPITLTGSVINTKTGDAEAFAFNVGGETLDDIAYGIQKELNELVDNRMLPDLLDPNSTNFDVSVTNDGRILIERGDDGIINGWPPTNKAVAIEYIGGTSASEELLSTLLGTYDINSERASNAIKFEQSVKASGSAGVGMVNNLSSFAYEIQNAVRANLSEDFEAYYDEGSGKIKYYNPEDNYPPFVDLLLDTDDIYGFSIGSSDPGSVFDMTVNADTADIVADDHTREDASSSKAFLTTVSKDTTLDRLFNTSGKSLGLLNEETKEGTIIYFDVEKGYEGLKGSGDSIFETAEPPTRDIGSMVDYMEYLADAYTPLGWFITTDKQGHPKTIEDFTNALNDYLGDNAESAVFEDGTIKITGNPGKANELTKINIQAFGSPVFNDFMQSEKYIQNASGGELTVGQQVYDSRGEKHSVTYNFQMLDNDTWRVRLNTPEQSGDKARFNISNPSRYDELLIDFEEDGTFKKTYYINADGSKITTDSPSFSISTGNGTEEIAVQNFDLSDISIAGEEGNITLAQDGHSVGYLTDVGVDEKGVVNLSYTNGMKQSVAKVALATFRNEGGLKKTGETLFGETGNSGVANISWAGAFGKGDIESGRLENSNVDMSKEMLELIITSRALSANTRVVTTSDEMIQELLGLKR